LEAVRPNASAAYVANTEETTRCLEKPGAESSNTLFSVRSSLDHFNRIARFRLK